MTATMMSEWDWRMSATVPPPSGNVGSNTGDWSATVLSLYFSYINSNGVDHRADLAALAVNDTIRINRATDSTVYSSWKVTGVPVDNSGYFTIPVSFTSGAGTPTAVTMTVVFAGAKPNLTVDQHMLNLCILGTGLIITPQSPPATLGADAIQSYRAIGAAYMADPDLPK